MKNSIYTLALAAVMGIMPVSATIHSGQLDELRTVFSRTFKEKLAAGDSARIFADFKAQAKAQKVPAVLSKLVTEETIADLNMLGRYPQHGIAEVTLVYLDKGLAICLVKRTDEKYAITFSHYEADGDSVTHKLAPITMMNPATKRPYFSLPESLMSQISNKQDQERIKLMHRILNENVAAMTPVYHLSAKKYAKGGYFGKMINTPLLFFGRQLQFFKDQFPEEEIAVRNELGYLYNGYEELSKHPQVYFSYEIYRATTPASMMQVYFHPGGNVYKPSVVFSTKHFDKLEHDHVATQLMEKADYLSYIQQQLHAMLKKQGVQPATSPDKEGLTPEQQILARWSNAMDHYMLRLTSQGGLTLPLQKKTRGNTYFAGSERMKIKHLAPIMGEENTKPVSDRERAKAQDTRKRSMEKSNALHQKEGAAEQKRLTKHMQSGGTAQNYDRNINP